MKFFKYLLLLTAGLICLSISPSAAFNQEHLKMLVPSESRFVTDLSGSWQRSDNMSYWTNVHLPASEQIQEKIIYKRFVKIPAEMIDEFSWKLYFLGIDHQVEIYWNGQFIARFVGSMVPFHVKIPDNAVRKETNEIRLVVLPSESKIKQIRNQHLNAKMIFSGILREILLIGTPQIWVSDVKLKTRIENKSTASVNALVSISSTDLRNLFKSRTLRDSSGSTLKSKDKLNLTLSAVLKNRITNEVIAESASSTFNVGSDRTITENLFIKASNINLWDINSPELYNLTITIKHGDKIIDDYTNQVGFRTITTAKDANNSYILMNEQIFEIKGVAYVEDYYKKGQTLSAANIIKDIDLIKKLGANAVRFKFSPPHPLFVQLCNQRGLLVLIELPVYDVPSDIINLDEIRVHMQNLAKQYLLYYDASPSVMAWGIGEGVDEDGINYKLFSESVIKLFSQDSDKLKYKIIPHGMEEIHTDGFDLIGYSDIRQNINFQQLNSEFKRILTKINGKPLFMTFGSEIQVRNHNGYSDPLSVEFQAFNILNSFKIVKKNNSAGCIINTFNDYLQNKPSLTTNNDNSNIHTSGIVDRKRLERTAFSTLQALFNNEKEPLLNAGSFSRSTPVIYLIIGILLAIMLAFMLNRFRRFREYMFRSLLRPYNFYADIRDQRIISSIQTLLLGVILAATVGIYLSSIFYFYKDSKILEYFLMISLPSNSLKEFAFTLIWMPELSFLIITVVSFALSFLNAYIIRMCAVLARARIYWNDCLTISIWSALPAIILLPVSIVLIRLLVLSPSLIWIFIFLYLITCIWTTARLLKSISVVFDIPELRAYIIGAIVIIIAIGAPFGYFHIKYSFFAYSKYFFNILLS